MKIILGADPLVPPLTGIGRYTFELAARLRLAPDIEEIRLFSFGRWLDFEQVAETVQSSHQTDAKSVSPPSLFTHARHRLASSKLAVAAYGRLSPLYFKRRLKPLAAEYLFHGPNFYLPPYDGPTVATIHDLSTFLRPQDHPPARVAFVEREVRKVIDGEAHLVTDSIVVKEEIIEFFGVHQERISAVPIGVDEQFRPRTNETLAPLLSDYDLTPGQYGLCVATLEPRKNISRLIKAYGKLPHQLIEQYPLVLIGDQGWKSEALHQQIETAQKRGWLRYLGYAPQRHLPAIYAGARGFFFPSLYEGFGLPVLEAMASGVPVLTSACSSMPEVAGEAALLVDPLDIEAIREGLERVLEDEAWRNSAISAGLSRSSELSWDACIDKTVEVYRTLLSDGKHRSA
jgi:alpha-1,3-rhamnosyl/mannosyltransferase